MAVRNVGKARRNCLRRHPGQAAQNGHEHAPGQGEVGGKLPVLVAHHKPLLRHIGNGGIGPVGVQPALVKPEGPGAPLHAGIPGRGIELAGLGGDAPAPEKFLHSHQFKSLGIQAVQQPVQTLGGALMGLVHDDDVPVPEGVAHIAHQPVGVLVFPVPRIHGAPDHRHPCLGQHPAVPAAIGGPKIKARLPRAPHPGGLGDGLGGGADLLADGGVAAVGQIGVVVGVVAHLVTLGHHPADLVGIGAHLIAVDKEGGLGPMVPQDIQNGVGIGPRAVVKGQCGQLLPRPVVGRGGKGPRHQARTQHQQAGSQAFLPVSHGQLPFFQFSE